MRYIVILLSLLLGQAFGQVVTVNPPPPSATNLSGVVAPANGGTGINNGSNTATFASSGTVGMLGSAQTWSGVQTLELPLVTDSTDKTKAIGFALSGATTATTLTLVSSQTASHNATIPVLAGADTFAMLGVANTFTATNAFAAVTATSVTDSGLSISQIPYAGTGGVLTGSSNFIFSTGNSDVRSVGGDFESYKDATPTKAFAIGHHSLAGGSITAAINLDYYNGSSWVNNSTFTDTAWTFASGAVVTVGNTTNSTTAATGAIVTSGGIGAAKQVISGMGFQPGTTTTATAAGTTTLTNTSTQVQIFTGSTTQILDLPAAALFGAGVSVHATIINRSTGTVTITRAGADTINAAATTFAATTLTITEIWSDGVSAWYTK